MKFFYDKWIPLLWGGLWIIAITAISIGVVTWSIQWVLRLLGVM